MNLHQLECFAVAADELHFGRAAAHLHIARSNMSKAIHALEHELGVEVFERTSREVHLTSAGALLLAHARRVLADAEELQHVARRAATGLVGELRLSYHPGTGPTVASLARTLRDHRPEVVVSVQQQRNADAIHAVKAGRSSIAVVRDAADTETAPLASLLLKRHPYCYVAMSPTHPLVERDVLRMADLDDVEFVLPTRAMSPHFYDTMLAFFRDVAITPRVCTHAVANAEQLLDLVALGTGVCLVIAEIRNQHARDDVVFRPAVGRMPTLYDLLLWRVDDTSPIVRAFINLSRDLALLAVSGQPSNDVDDFGSGAPSPKVTTSG